MVKPTVHRQEVCQGDSKLSLCFVLQLNHYHIAFKLEFSEDFRNCQPPNEHGMLFIDLFVWVESLLVDNNDPFFPFPSELRFFKDFPILISLWLNFFWEIWHFLLTVFSEFGAHGDNFLLNNFSKNIIMKR